jgi:hypothetical protein
VADEQAPWIAAPKNRALYHVLQVTGTALEGALPHRANQLDQAKRTLRTVRADRDGTALQCEVEGRTLTSEIAGGTFRFYRRGDVPALVAKRTSDVADREDNWAAAVSFWADLLDFDEIERTAANTAAAQLAPRTAPTDAGPPFPLVTLGCSLVILTLTVAGWAADSRAMLGAAAAAAVFTGTASFVDLRRRIVATLGAVALGAALVAAAAPSLDAARLGVLAAGGLAASALSGRLACRHTVAGAGAAALAGALTGFAGGWWLALMIALLLLDLLATVLRANRIPRTTHACMLLLAVGGGIVTMSLSSNAFEFDHSAANGRGWMIVAAFAAVALMSFAAEFVHGTRDVLAPIALPAFVLVGVVFADADVRLAVAAGALASQVTALAGGHLRLAKKVHPKGAGSPSPARQTAAGLSQPVSLRPRSTR